MKKLNFIILLFVLFISCHSQQKSDMAEHKAIVNYPVSIIKISDSIIKIDEKVIYYNKNLQPFINDLQRSSFSVSYKIDGIPDFIISFLNQLSGDHFTIANPGKDWNCCDDNWNDSLPNRELICQGIDKNLFFISYLTGGIGEAEHIILIRYDNNKVIDFWTNTMLSENLKNKNEIVRYLLKLGNKVHYNLSI